VGARTVDPVSALRPHAPRPTSGKMETASATVATALPARVSSSTANERVPR
jgi:hypothetical protein